MNDLKSGTRDALTRTASTQLIWLGLAATIGFAILMGLLYWVSALTGSHTATLDAIDEESGTVTLLLRTEPPQLDSTRATDSVSISVLGHVMEGLLRFDENNQLAPGVAERWEIREDGATFWLRPDARWSDGVPVTAHDFVFAWRTAISPATASEYAFILYPVKNGESINSGNLPVEALGVRAVNNQTLEVEFEQPLAYFEELVAFSTYHPIRESFYHSREGRYGADVDDLLYNGPFEMTLWVHGAHVRLEKNPDYWDRERIRLNVIDMPYFTTDATSALNLFKDGKVAVMDYLGAEQLNEALQQRWQLKRFGDGSVWFLAFNFSPDRVTSNWHLRKALQLITDPSELVNRVIKLPGNLPGESLFPVWLQGVNTFFRQEYPVPKIELNLEAAREHLQIAMEELGLDNPPSIALLVDDSPGAAKQAEYFQNLYGSQLGLEIRIDRQIFKQRLAKMQNQDFDLAVYGWGPDFADPLTFGELFASWNPNNNGRFNNTEYDESVRLAQSSLNPQIRMEAFARQQEILIEEVALIPNYERGRVYITDRRLQGVVRRAVGPDPDYTNAFISSD
ncbi:MAG: peptide ABC transporter substrate-binding protein [Gammaproteobacteria bacterium]|nr:peptide ABC transporter substrate-binding protein [Gammaproteobacteria bacterium]